METSPFTLLERGDVAGIQKYVSEHPESINKRTFFAGGTLLHYAAAESTPEVIDVLVGSGFDLDKAGETYGDTPLHAASANGKSENVKKLLSLGARLDTSTSYTNPLFGAIIGSSPDGVTLLLNAGIDPRIQYRLDDGSIVDALGFARKRGESECERVIEAFLQPVSASGSAAG